MGTGPRMLCAGREAYYAAHGMAYRSVNRRTQRGNICACAGCVGVLQEQQHLNERRVGDRCTTTGGEIVSLVDREILVSIDKMAVSVIEWGVLSEVEKRFGLDALDYIYNFPYGFRENKWVATIVLLEEFFGGCSFVDWLLAFRCFAS